MANSASAEESKNYLADEWAYWLDTKRFLAPPAPKHILVALAEKNKTRKEPPNADFNAAMVAFNMAVNNQPERNLAAWLIVTFKLRIEKDRPHFDHRDKSSYLPLKACILELGFNQVSTFYKCAHATDDKIMREYRQIKFMHECIQREVQAYV